MLRFIVAADQVLSF